MCTAQFRLINRYSWTDVQLTQYQMTADHDPSHGYDQQHPRNDNYIKFAPGSSPAGRQDFVCYHRLANLVTTCAVLTRLPVDTGHCPVCLRRKLPANYLRNIDINAWCWRQLVWCRRSARWEHIRSILCSGRRCTRDCSHQRA